MAAKPDPWNTLDKVCEILGIDPDENPVTSITLRVDEDSVPFFEIRRRARAGEAERIADLLNGKAEEFRKGATKPYTPANTTDWNGSLTTASLENGIPWFCEHWTVENFLQAVAACENAGDAYGATYWREKMAIKACSRAPP